MTLDVTRVVEAESRAPSKLTKREKRTGVVRPDPARHVSVPLDLHEGELRHVADLAAGAAGRHRPLRRSTGSGGDPCSGRGGGSLHHAVRPPASGL